MYVYSILFKYLYLSGYRHAHVYPVFSFSALQFKLLFFSICFPLLSIVCLFFLPVPLPRLVFLSLDCFSSLKFTLAYILCRSSHFSPLLLLSSLLLPPLLVPPVRYSPLS